MARGIGQAGVFALGMLLVEYAAKGVVAPALHLVLFWSGLWWYIPFGIAGAASLRGWRRALPIIAAELVAVGLIASPTTMLAVERIAAPLLLGAVLGFGARWICLAGGTREPAHHATRTTSR